MKCVRVLFAGLHDLRYVKETVKRAQNLEFFMSVKYYIMSTLVENHSNSRF